MHRCVKDDWRLVRCSEAFACNITIEVLTVIQLDMNPVTLHIKIAELSNCVLTDKLLFDGVW